MASYASVSSGLATLVSAIFGSRVFEKILEESVGSDFNSYLTALRWETDICFGCISVIEFTLLDCRSFEKILEILSAYLIYSFNNEFECLIAVSKHEPNGFQDAKSIAFECFDTVIKHAN